MNEQEKAAQFSADVDRLLQGRAGDGPGDWHTDEDRALLALAREMASMDFSHESRTLRHDLQAKGDNGMFTGMNGGRRALVALGAALFLLMASAMMVAPVRAFAQEMLQGLFVRHESDRLASEPPHPAAGPTATAVPLPGSVPDMTIDQARALAPFTVKELAALPDGFSLASVYYGEDEDKVTLLYVNDAHLGISLHQQPAGTVEPWPIGTDAVVEDVTVGDTPAEFVRGSWRWLEPEGDLIGVSEMEWRDDDPYQQLRWIEGDVAYTLGTTVGQNMGLTQADLIGMAESLK